MSLWTLNVLRLDRFIAGGEKRVNTVRQEDRLAWQGGAMVDGVRSLAVEAPVALVVNGSTFAVMLATPGDLEDFAVGFALTEGIVDDVGMIESFEVVPQVDGIEARLWIAEGQARTLADRRRHIAGPTGCGLCGIDSLAEAARVPRRIEVAGPRPLPAEIIAAMDQLGEHQPIGRATRAVHAAALWRRGAPLLVREDVGRHNALDKLVGAVRRSQIDTEEAMLLLTSRVSIEMVQKTSILGAPILVAVSAPTSLAVDYGRDAGLTLVAVARSDGFEVFAGSERIDWPVSTPRH